LLVRAAACPPTSSIPPGRRARHLTRQALAHGITAAGSRWVPGETTRETEAVCMLTERDFVIFLLLLLSVVSLKFLPIAPGPRLFLFALIVIGQVIFVYQGLKRSRR